MFAKILEKRTESKSGNIVTLKLEIVNNKNFTAKPGQFLMVWIPGINEKPFSISKISKNIEITIQKVGNFTEKLINLNVNDKIGIRGPYGNFFNVYGEKILVVSGGIGIAPLAQLCEIFKDKKFFYAIGAKNINELIFLERIKKNENAEIFVSTDDGSYGKKGFVTDLAKEILNEKFDSVIACGKKEMLIELYKILKNLNLKDKMKIEFSFDSYIKCGIGICGTCAIGKFLVCKDGPIFRNDELEYIFNLKF
ncbi:MAG: dihydroorotate dehydrogenase electron transfer subunit [Candidatus Altarchaeaceae archaeon]